MILSVTLIIYVTIERRDISTKLINLLYIFIFGFLPGLFYYRFKDKNNKLIKYALTLNVTGMILVNSAIFFTGDYYITGPLGMLFNFMGSLLISLFIFKEQHE